MIRIAPEKLLRCSLRDLYKLCRGDLEYLTKAVPVSRFGSCRIEAIMVN